MSGFGWIPAEMGPQTTAKAVPMAVTEALKSRGLAPFPRTSMAISSNSYTAVVGVAEDTLRGTGLFYRINQVWAELKSRGYHRTGIAGAFGQVGPYRNGPAATGVTYGVARPGVPPAIYEAARRAEMITAFKAIALPTALIGGGLLVLFLVYKKRR